MGLDAAEPCLNQDNKWFVLFTKPKFERKIHGILSKKNIDTFLPMTKHVSQWSDRKKVLLMPLFPNYLFVKMPFNERHVALEINGAIRFLGIDKRPCSVDDELIQNIKKIVVGESELSVRNYVVGQRVRLSGGPMKGLSGVLTEYKGRKRLAVSVELMRQFILVDVADQHLETI